MGLWDKINKSLNRYFVGVTDMPSKHNLWPEQQYTAMENIYNDAQQQLAQINAQQQLTHINEQYSYLKPLSAVDLHYKARSMLQDRLGTINSRFQPKEGDFMWCHVDMERQKVFVFFVFDGQDGSTSEGLEMFPSDTLVAQLRMILK